MSVATQFTLRPPGTSQQKLAVLDPGSATSPSVSTAAQSGMYREGTGTGITVNGVPRVVSSAGNVAILGNTITGSNVITTTHRLTVGGERRIDGMPAVQPTWQNLGAYVDPPTPALQLTLSNVSTYGNTVTQWGSTAQTNLGNRPTYIQVDPLDEKPAIAFDRTALQHLQKDAVTLNCETNGGLTFVAMFKFSGTPGSYEDIFYAGTLLAANTIDFARILTNNTVTFAIRNGSTSLVARSIQNIPQNQWNVIAYRYLQVAGTWTLQAFRNDVKDGETTSTGPITNRTVPVFIGRQTSSTLYHFNGSVRYLGVWDRPLTDAELAKVTEAARIYPDLQGTPPICRFLQGSRDSCTVDTASDMIMPGPSGFPGARALAGAVALSDGRVFCVPWLSAPTARILDPRTGAVTTPNVTFPSGGAAPFQGGVLLPNGKVFLVPRNSTYAMQFDPVTETVFTCAPAFPGPPGAEPFVGAVGLPDGRVVMIPYNATYSFVYDYITDTVTTIGNGAFPGASSYIGGTLLADGRVLCVPFSASKARIIDVNSNTVTTPNGNWPGSGAFYGGAVLLPDSRVFIAPSSSTTARIYDPSLDVLSTPNGTYQSTGYRSAVLLPCGRVVMIPYNASNCVIYDPQSDTLTTARGTIDTPDTSYQGGVVLQDGRVFMVPSNTTQGLYLHAGGHGFAQIPQNVMVSPWLNNKI